MMLYAKGKVLKQEGDEAVIQLSNEELGRAVLSYIINNETGDIGEKFMNSLFSGKPMTLNELILNRTTECSEDEFVKKNEILDNSSDDVEYVSDCNDDNVKVESALSNLELAGYIDELRSKDSVRLAAESLEEIAPTVYDKIICGKSGMNKSLLANCDFVFDFDEYGVSYSFVKYRGEKSDTITPNNNVVVSWDTVNEVEVLELLEL